jgi:PmbA protein
VVSGTGAGWPPGDLLSLADGILARARRAGADEAEVLLVATRSALTRFANSEIHQNVAEEDLLVNLRVVVGRRTGVASTNRAASADLDRLAETATAIARQAAESPEPVSLPDPAPVEPVPGAYARATAEATPTFRATAVAEVVAAAEAAGVEAAGSFATDVETIAVANTRGVGVVQERTTAQLLTVMASPDGGSGYAEACAVDATTIDPRALGEEAAARARRSARPIALEPGDYPVVLEPYAVVDILDMLAFLGLSALAVQEGRSFFAPGRRVGSPLVTIVDDGRDPAGLPLAFDYEGVPKERVVLIEGGLCRAVVHDARTAAREGRRSTGHALPAPNPWGPLPMNLFMEPGDADREGLLRGLRRGLLVTRFHYTNPVHPKRVIVTGMTRDGTFLVEDGEVVGPVRNLRYTQNYLDALAAVEAVGRERRVLRGFLGAAVVPAVRIGAWTFTGATES